MGRFEREIIINAPAAKVFEYLADFTKHPEWGNQPMEITKTTDGPVGLGTVFDHHGTQFGKHHDVVTITEFVPGKSLAWDSKGDSGLIKHWFHLEEQGATTRLSKGSDFAGGKFAVKLASPFINKAAPKDIESNLAKIKAKVEAGG